MFTPYLFLGEYIYRFFSVPILTQKKNTCFFPRERWGEKNTTSYRTEVQPTFVAARCLDIWSYICHTLTWPIGCVVCLSGMEHLELSNWRDQPPPPLIFMFFYFFILKKIHLFKQIYIYIILIALCCRLENRFSKYWTAGTKRGVAWVTLDGALSKLWVTNTQRNFGPMLVLLALPKQR